MKVVVSHHDDRYHAPKKGFYCKCGADFNPHHAGRIERKEAVRQEYEPCDECGLSDDDDEGGEEEEEGERKDMVQRQIDAGHRDYDDYRYPSDLDDRGR